MKIRTTTVTKYPRTAKPDKVVICLARTTSDQMCSEYSRLIEAWGNYPVVVVGFHPEKGKWFDEKDPSIEDARISLQEKIEEKLLKLDIPKRRAFIVGFSQGAVMGLDVVSHSEDSYAGLVIHSGKIIDHENLPEARHPMEIVLTHNLDDKIYSFNEEFKPMEKTLKEKGYKTRSESRMKGGHFYQTSQMTPVIMNTLLLASHSN
ncbi:MAG: alpha/beta hydrolase [Candidatus Thorarchaeota archaeon]